MPEALEQAFIKRIQHNEGIIHKLIGLHVDTEEDRKDLYQEILLQAWKSYPKFSGKASFSTWLYRISLNTIFTSKRKSKKVVPDFPQEARKQETPEVHERLYQAIKKLNSIDRTLITLHLDSYTNKEISEILGISTNHVNVKIHRIKTQLIKTLKQESYGPQ